jgi:DNA recombination protein RmuC
MLTIILVLEAVLLLAVLALFLRQPKAFAPAAEDPRLAQLADQITRMDARGETLERHLRDAVAQMRTDIGSEAHATREAAASAAAIQRTELQHTLTTIRVALDTRFDSFREDNKSSAETLRLAVQTNLDSIAQRLAGFISDAHRDRADAQATLHTRLNELGAAHTDQQDKLRATVQERLEHLNTTNTAKLEEMRATVDEKLQSTLHTRLTESFGQVTDQLNKVHTGLGEMSKLSEGVDGLSRIFTNVKSRGGFAEVQLGVLLRQMLAPSQFVENANVKAGTSERVEYAVRFPTNAGERLLPIDAKFPLDAWERLESAYESNEADAIQREGRNFENAIRNEAERICKYINPPVTTPYGIMFLPTEGLYAEVIRREALQADIQSKCHVTIAGPTTLSAILTSFQMGFHMLALQEKGDEVWRILEQTKSEFRNFETLMGKMEKQVGTVQNTIQLLGTRTRAITKSLREVSDSAATSPLDLDDLAGATLQLAASGEDA